MSIGRSPEVAAKDCSTHTLSLVYKGHDLQGSLDKILAKISVRSEGELDKQFEIRVKGISY